MAHLPYPRAWRCVSWMGHGKHEGTRRDGKSEGKGLGEHSLVMANHTGITMAGSNEMWGQDSPARPLAGKQRISISAQASPPPHPWGQVASNGLKGFFEFRLGQKTPDLKSCTASFFSFTHLPTPPSNHGTLNPSRVPLSPQPAHQVLELGPFAGVVVPAARHEGVEDRGAEVGLGQAVTPLQHPDHVLVLQPEEGLLAVAQDLPHTHGCGSKTSDLS